MFYLSFIKHQSFIMKHWNDNLLTLHPKMSSVIKKHSTDSSSFICVVCEKCKSTYCSGKLKNMISHYEGSKHHKLNMEKEGLLPINSEIINALKSQSASNKIKDTEGDATKEFVIWEL